MEESLTAAKTSDNGNSSCNSGSAVVALCCFHLTKAGCSLPPGNGANKTCRWRHADDDGSACCFGPACKRGHAKRVLPEGKEAQAEFWKKWNAEGHAVGQRPCDRDATQLRAQLEPWGTAVLRKKLVHDFDIPEEETTSLSRAEVTARLMDEFNKWSQIQQQQQQQKSSVVHSGGSIEQGMDLDGDKASSDAQDGGVGARGKRPRDGVTTLEGVVIEYHSGRKVVRANGTLVRPELMEEIQAAMSEWSAKYKINDRPTIAASSYMILRSPAEFSQKDSKSAVKAATKLKQHQKVWDLAYKALSEVDPEFADKFTALAMTCNFKGSPHIDNQNTGPFYGMSLGTFPDGEAGVMVEVDTFTIAHVNTKNRLGKVDGRYPHWVAPYDQSLYERYSLIYYQTDGGYAMPGPSYFPPSTGQPEKAIPTPPPTAGSGCQSSSSTG